MDGNEKNKEKECARPRSYRTWALVIAFIACLLVGAFFLNKILSASGKLMDKGSDLVKGMFGTTVYNQEIIFSTIGEVKKQAKLVVMMTEITVEVERSSTKKFMWNYYDLGTTTVRMKVPGNKVQYYINTDSLSEKNIRWDESIQDLILDLPDPILDEDIVEVQSDPKKILIEKDIGWARLESKSGKEMEDQIRSELREKVIKEGKHELLIERAKTNAEQVVRDLFNRLKKAKEREV